MTIKGYIEVNLDEDDNITSVWVRDENVLIDLHAAFENLSREYRDHHLAISYWVVDEAHTRDEIIQEQIKWFYGAPYAEWYSSGSGGNTSWTGNWTASEAEAGVGKHNILSELSDKHGKYLHLEIRERTDTDPPDPPRKKSFNDIIIDRALEKALAEMDKRLLLALHLTK